MPLYQLIFLEECKCMSEDALEAIREYGDYFFSEEGTYLRMYGGIKAPSLLPKYDTNYSVHKEAVRQLFLDGFGSFLFDMKNFVFPPMPFYVSSYKFSRVKSALDFVKDLEDFHFGEKFFHRNNSRDKLVAQCAMVKENFEYSDYLDKDEEIFKNACNMTALNKQFR